MFKSEDLIAMARAAEKDERLSDGALYGKLADEIERIRLTRFHIIGYAVIAVMLMGLGAQLFMLADTFFNWR